jgi:hypothetical protein
MVWILGMDGFIGEAGIALEGEGMGTGTGGMHAMVYMIDEHRDLLTDFLMYIQITHPMR